MSSAKKIKKETLIVSSITSKGQTTVPLKIRQLLGVNEGDELKYEIISPNVVQIKKLSQSEKLWANAMEQTLTEWMDSTDDDL